MDIFRYFSDFQHSSHTRVCSDHIVAGSACKSCKRKTQPLLLGTKMYGCIAHQSDYYKGQIFRFIRHPEVKWAQRRDKVYITLLLPDAKNVKVNLEPDGLFTFSATAGAENHFYELKLNLFDKVNVEESKINTGVRSIFCMVEKAEKVWWNKLLCGDEKTPHYVKVDWDKWVDEDEDDNNGPPNDLDLGGMDFSKLGNMDEMGEGMGNDFDDSDDEDEGAEKTTPEATTEVAAPEAKAEAASST